VEGRQRHTRGAAEDSLDREVNVTKVAPADRRFVAALKAKWMNHAPQYWWGDRVDARFLVARAVGSMQGRTILDVGCNAGVILSEIPDGNRRVGIDRSIDAIRLAHQLNPTVPLVVADMFGLPFRESSFDVVLFCGMLEIPDREEKARVMSEVARVLTASGELFLTTPNRRHLRYKRNRFMSTVSHHELTSLLRPYFDADVRGFNPFPPFPYFLPNRLLARFPGIWRLLTALMRWGIGTHYGTAFFVRGVKRCSPARPPR
jgi:SAM-dependent methyltransferase